MILLASPVRTLCAIVGVALLVGCVARPKPVDEASLREAVRHGQTNSYYALRSVHYCGDDAEGRAVFAVDQRARSMQMYAVEAAPGTVLRRIAADPFAFDTDRSRWRDETMRMTTWSSESNDTILERLRGGAAKCASVDSVEDEIELVDEVRARSEVRRQFLERVAQLGPIGEAFVFESVWTCFEEDYGVFAILQTLDDVVVLTTFRVEPGDLGPYAIDPYGDELREVSLGRDRRVPPAIRREFLSAWREHGGWFPSPDPEISCVDSFVWQMHGQDGGIQAIGLATDLEQATGAEPYSGHLRPFATILGEVLGMESVFGVDTGG